jgi:hypothetical protein
MWFYRSLRWLALLCITCLATACGAEQTDLTLYSQDRYRVVSTITVSAESLASRGQAEVEKKLDEHVAQFQADGAQAEWRQGKSSGNGDAVYVLEIIGQGYNEPPLSNYVKVEPATDENGKPALKATVVLGAPLFRLILTNLDIETVTTSSGEILKAAIGRLTELVEGVLDPSTAPAQEGDILDTLRAQVNEMTSGAQEGRPLTLPFTVHGSKIIESNGIEIRDSVKFDLVSVLASGKPPYVILRPKAGLAAGFRWQYLVIGVVGLALVGGMAFLIFRPRPKKRYVGTVFCPHCGSAQKRGTRICSRCRRPLPRR